MQVRCAHPERTVVGHPFNPPYLIPLVEVVGGTQTSPDVVAWTSDFFRHAGKSVITMDREVPGFIANRLQEALWREALHMVAAGEATVEQIDLSITDGPGLRWPIHGPMLTFHLAGGQGGMAHMLDHFGPSLLAPWTRLQAAKLTPELRDAMVDGCERGGRRPDDRRSRGRTGPRGDRGAARSRASVTFSVWREPVQDESYEVKTSSGKKITFLDTPGHEAFTAMRARGAKVTDISVIVVAADDAVMPQTREAISHSQAANVPMIFAVNKIDKEGANPQKIYEQLAGMNILVEEWGGKYQSRELSAKKGLNVDLLLEKILLRSRVVRP